MAENERLDLLKNRRWLRVMRFIASNPHEGDVPRRLTEAMYRTLRSVGKQIPLEELLKAAASRQPGFEAVAAQWRAFSGNCDGLSSTRAASARSSAA